MLNKNILGVPGPRFLSEQEQFWPNIPTSFKSEEASKEVTKNLPAVIHSLASLEDSRHPLPDLKDDRYHTI